MWKSCYFPKNDSMITKWGLHTTIQTESDKSKDWYGFSSCDKSPYSITKHNRELLFIYISPLPANFSLWVSQQNLELCRKWWTMWSLPCKQAWCRPSVVCRHAFCYLFVCVFTWVCVCTRLYSLCVCVPLRSGGGDGSQHLSLCTVL